MLQICSNLLKTAAPTQSSASLASMELENFVRDIVCSMRRVPEERWNDVKMEIMLVTGPNPSLQAQVWGTGHRQQYHRSNPTTTTLVRLCTGLLPQPPQAHRSTCNKPNNGSSPFCHRYHSSPKCGHQKPECSMQLGVTSSVTTNGTTATVTDTRGSDVGEFLFQL